MKYTTSEVTFREIPDEITLCINISNCPIHCPDCHSKELWEDIGDELTKDRLIELLQNNPGISCVCLMGGDADYEGLHQILIWLSELRRDFGAFKIAWYSGRHNLDEVFMKAGDWVLCFQYIKVGPYRKDLGGLDSKTTNQQLYMVSADCRVHNITYKFWKKDGTTTDD